MTDGPVLEIRDVTRRYPGRTAVDGASLALRSGRIACLLGPSGCGKSTLLRMIAGLEPVDSGEIRLRGAVMSAPGRQVAPEDRGVGLVFQDNALFPHLDVAGNVGFGLSGVTKAERHAKVADLLARFHVDHLAKAWPHMLSGGEQQRVAIARALAREPSLLLLDEPFSGLDGDLRERVRQSLLADLRDAGATVLIVTHDPEEAMGLADDLILMSEGRILQSGDPRACYDRPVSAAAARLLGEAIVLPATVADGVARTALGPVPAAGMADGAAEILARPEHIRLGQGDAAATVAAVRFVGRHYRVDLAAGDLALSLRLADDPPAPGGSVALALDPASAIVLPTGPG
ncbi:MAG TPA: ABC transporter ATP-binding protein [Sphingopyxis sp.]|nr:ABC transporter ATP-binding protein [Sphingopyxis sp.]HMP45251.1 ABC transporter ATP-binding protein [Sphingopyxis sp.]HMQ19917.1 ABC transporter ATP-binding protein [Sphingopyxis sp.]